MIPMQKINKLAIFKALMDDPKFIHNSAEESTVGNALVKESWLVATSDVKQRERRDFLKSAKRRGTVINLDYYEKMILVYNMLLEILSKVEKLIHQRESENETVEIPLLRITALVLIEQDFIDEYILPLHHIRPTTFQDISKELDTKYPELKLKEFSEKYSEMYSLWPERTKYEINKT